MKKCIQKKIELKKATSFRCFGVSAILFVYGYRVVWASDEVQERTGERDRYERKLVETEKKLAALQAAYDAVTSPKGDETSLRRELEELKNSLAQSQAKLNDRARLMANQDNQINALTKQVSSLKEVVAITKNLLEIRNMEVKHLQVGPAIET